MLYLPFIIITWYVKVFNWLYIANKVECISYKSACTIRVGNLINEVVVRFLLLSLKYWSNRKLMILCIAMCSLVMCLVHNTNLLTHNIIKYYIDGSILTVV